MKIARLIDELSRPAAYPHDVEAVEVRQTHISAVFLAGSFAYKVKKPLDLEFLDFTTLEKRRHFCREEVRLNRRLAPEVYLGAVPIVRAGTGLRVGGDGEPVEYAVKMRRLPDDARLLSLVERDALEPGVLDRLGARIAAFHREAESGTSIARFGRFDVVAGNARENLEQSRSHVGSTISEEVHRRLATRLEEVLESLRPVIEDRARRQVPRDTHGDLHLDHVYLFPEREPPGDLVVIDCVEFNERFRYADPVADMAFLAMDLVSHGRRDLERRFSDAYFRAARDPEGRRLLPFYRSYRGGVRGKVEGIAAGDEEVPVDERRRAAQRARGHWLLALSEIERPGRRPALLLVAGLPGTGKSTLARRLADRAGFRVIASDRVRKEIAGLDPDASAEADFGEGIYTAESSRRTYEACLDRSREVLFRGGRVLVDATFRRERDRARFLRSAREWGVRAALLVCEAPPDVVRGRLRDRQGGVSDADWDIHRKVAEQWEEPTVATRRAWFTVSTADTPEASVRRAVEHLRRLGLADPEG